MSVAPPPRQRKPKAAKDAPKEQHAAPTIKEKNRALREEVDALRARLGMKEPRKLDDWVSLPQEMRDELAVRAIWQNMGDHTNALKYLGFDMDSGIAGAFAEHKRIVFDTPGVRALLERSFEEGAANRAMTVARMSKIVATSSDDAAVRAATVLTKLEGWNKEQAAPQAPTVVNLWTLTAGAKDAARIASGEIVAPTKALPNAPPPDDPFVVLGYEPGAPQKFDPDADAE